MPGAQNEDVKEIDAVYLQKLKDAGLLKRIDSAKIQSVISRSKKYNIPVEYLIDSMIGIKDTELEKAVDKIIEKFEL